jgi:hypothetical protein
MAVAPPRAEGDRQLARRERSRARALEQQEREGDRYDEAAEHHVGGQQQ